MKLNTGDRYLLYSRFQKNDEITALLLNGLFVGLGSWIQGDNTGAIVSEGCFYGGLLLLYIGYYSDISWIGLALVITGLVENYYAPFGFANEWNQQLRQSLYMAGNTTPQLLIPAYSKNDKLININVFSCKF